MELFVIFLNFINNFIHAVVHTTSGVDYPHGHWILTGIAFIVFILSPIWLSVYIFKNIFAIIYNIYKRRSRIKNIIQKKYRPENNNADNFINQKTESDQLLYANSATPINIDPLQIVYFVAKTTRLTQIKLIVLSIMTLPAAWLLLDIPKHIINNALSESSALAEMKFFGFHFQGLELLYTLCLSYFIVLTVSAIVKFAANQVRGHVNETIVRRLRLRIVRASRYQLKNKIDTNFAAVAVQEVEPIGYFGSSLFVVPLIHGGTLVISLAFLFAQNAAFAISALIMLPIQVLLIPRMQKKLNGIVRKRVYITRHVGDFITKNASVKTDNKKIDFKHYTLKYQHDQIESLERVRIEINDLKGKMKGIYNYTSSLTPFLIFAVGGYLVVQDRLSLGSLVAALAAYREIAPALRELFDFAQSWSDASARFDEITRVLAEADSSRQISC